MKKHYEAFAATESKKRATFLINTPGEEIRALTPQFNKEDISPKNKELWDHKFAVSPRFQMAFLFTHGKCDSK